MRPVKYLHIVLFILVMGCKDPIPTPEAALLLLPEADQSCLYVSVDSAKARVVFSWQISLHTDTYTINVVNLVTQELTSIRTEEITATLTLDRGTPYRWEVISSSELSDKETPSESRLFYLEGEQQFSYVPFPAKLVSPQMNEVVSLNNGSINLTWEGLDLDDDIDSYAVFFGTTEDDLEEIATGLVDSNLSVSLEANTSYVWQVITRDELNNISTSPYFRFQTAP
ncbi:hypothetical protein OAP99_00705 [Flavobacteriaceae bacterium]|nr:hypothetical protein [Flavobacteriaceae bacterium]MDC1060690.1 hypothetical protein [Flavobacteriaceae bacterium]